MIIDSRTPYAMIENEIIKAQLTSYEIAAYVCLCVHSNKKDEAWPSYPTIAEETGMSARHASRAVKTLIGKGWIGKKVEPGKKTIYTIIGIPLTTSPGGMDYQSRVPRTTSPPNNNHMNNNNEQYIRDKQLYQDIKKAFESKYGRFENYAREGRAIKEIITKGNLLREGESISRMIATFHGLVNGRDKFWSTQPFLPSVLNSSGIWPRVKLAMHNGEQECPATEAYVREKLAKRKLT